jgi:hypothetical protein
MPWAEEVLPIARIFIHDFEHTDDQEAFFKLFANSGVAVDVFNTLYRQFLKDNAEVEDKHKVTPVENLPEEQKERLFEHAKALSIKQNREYIIKVCKAIHTFNKIVE